MFYLFIKKKLVNFYTLALPKLFAKFLKKKENAKNI